MGGAGSPAQMRRAEGINFNQNNHVVIQNDGTNGLPGPQMMKAVYDMARKGAVMKFRHRCVMVAYSPEVDDENLPLESETRYGCSFGPSVRKVRFGDGYSQRAPAGLNANLKTYSVTLSVPVRRPRYWSRFWKSTGLESLSVDAPYEWRQIKVTCAKWSSRVSMLRVEFSAEFEQVVN